MRLMPLKYELLGQVHGSQWRRPCFARIGAVSNPAEEYQSKLSHAEHDE